MKRVRLAWWDRALTLAVLGPVFFGVSVALLRTLLVRSGRRRGGRAFPWWSPLSHGGGLQGTSLASIMSLSRWRAFFSEPERSGLSCVCWHRVIRDALWGPD